MSTEEKWDTWAEYESVAGVYWGTDVGFVAARVSLPDWV